jgi:hypothetical protein
MTESEHAIPASPAAEPRPSPLKQALRQARIDAAERTGVVVDLRDAELARLELLNEALDPVFADVPPEIEVFDRGISKGDSPRLWVDMVAHVSMGRDKRTYRFLQDSRFGRRVLAESADIVEVAQAITHYVARRLVERERALAGETPASAREARHYDGLRRRRLWRILAAFVLGMATGAVALLVAAWFLDPLLY